MARSPYVGAGERLGRSRRRGVGALPWIAVAVLVVAQLAWVNSRSAAINERLDRIEGKLERLGQIEGQLAEVLRRLPLAPR